MSKSNVSSRKRPNAFFKAGLLFLEMDHLEAQKNTSMQYFKGAQTKC